MGLRLSLVTLGVGDVEASARFYEALGPVRGAPSNDSVVFFDMDGVILALYGRAALATDARLADDRGSGFSGVTLAWNCRSEAEVDGALEAAFTAGGRVVKPAEKVFWGGYSGYFADPDGHLWEVAHNPFFPFDQRGAVRLPGA